MQNFWRPFFFIAVLGLAFLCYQPGLYGDFEFDDQVNLLSNTDLHIDDISLPALKLAALSGGAGPLGRPISMASFAINHVHTGFDPYYLKLTNLIIHIISGALLYFLLLQLLHAYRRTYSIQLTNNVISWIAIASSAAWLLHPLNITSVLYIVQRMTSLSGLFSLLALLFYVIGRNQILDNKQVGWWAILLATPVAGLIAIFCKENAALLPLFIGLVEWCFFQFRTPSRSTAILLHGTLAIALWLPLLMAFIYLVIHPAWFLEGYGGRGFSLTERLLTESRVLWLYLRLILAPDIALMGIYHDDIPISINLFSPSTTFPAIIGLLSLLLLAIGVRNRAPILAFGLLWFFIGHLIESSIIPLEIAHEHRNYLPMIGILFASFYYLLNPGVTQRILRIRGLLTLLLIAMLGFSTHVRAMQWGDLLEHAIIEAENHPDSPRAQQQLGRMYFKLHKYEAREEFYQKALKSFQTASALDPHFKNGLYGRIILDYNAGRTPPAEIINDFLYRLQYNRREPGDISMLNSLVQCQLSGDCKLPDQTVIEALEIEVARYKYDPPRQATFLSFLGAYAAQKMDNADLAGKYLRQAVSVNPTDVQGRLNLAWYLTVIGQHHSAEKQLNAARTIDREANKFTRRIESLKKSIIQRRAASQQHDAS
ncbi:MAG TPA: tetratricopeptide repeat protein [Methylophilaceae bacterium]|nr:tetratricopeptide repeat protein [Methylophilaceae bacterium]